MRNKIFINIGLLFCVIFFNMTNSFAQYQPLYKTIPNNIPTKNQELESSNAGILIIEKVSIPTYQYFRVANDNQKRPCVIICPGGGYAILAAGHEGSDVAKYFNSIGVNALVLKYRIPNNTNQIDKTIAPLQDAQQAILLARTNAGIWGIDENKIGIMGFSAGGHLAASLATHYNDVKIDNPTKVSLRPDFQILIYPVISFGPEGHEGSRINLIGNANDEKTKNAIAYFSSEKQITKEAPPAFLVHSKDDDVVPVANATYYYDNLKALKVSAELYLYEKGGHGYGMKNPTSEIIWTSVMKTWMQKNKIIQ
ncbi:MAG: alpha/beta hydrolase [Chitinophagaceae bacterium]|jgi:acetyl esterase/lipase|nr:alpha/beta hydrolase [Chitinophagaceae bacterium]